MTPHQALKHFFGQILLIAAYLGGAGCLLLAFAMPLLGIFGIFVCAGLTLLAENTLIHNPRLW